MLNVVKETGITVTNEYDVKINYMTTKAVAKIIILKKKTHV